MILINFKEIIKIYLYFVNIDSVNIILVLKNKDKSYLLYVYIP